MRRIKTAVIGTGFMGRVHCEGIRRLGNVDIIAVAANTKEEASNCAKSMGVDRSTDDYKSILEDKQIDAIHVCTPNVLHYPVSKEALLAGKAVLCEKPLTMSAAEARDLVAVAKQTGLPNCVNHNLRYYPVLQHVRPTIETADL